MQEQYYYGLCIELVQPDTAKRTQILLTQELPDSDGNIQPMAVLKKETQETWEILKTINNEWQSKATYNKNLGYFNLEYETTDGDTLDTAETYSHLATFPLLNLKNNNYTPTSVNLFRITEDTKNKIIKGQVPSTVFINMPENEDLAGAPFYKNLRTFLELTPTKYPNLTRLNSLNNPLIAPYFAIISTVTKDQKSLEHMQSVFNYKTESATDSSPPTSPFEPALTDFHLRPNGEKYYPRKWGGKEDVKILKTAREHGLCPFFTGPPGTGKTALCEAAFGEELLTVVITGDTEVTDLIGSFIPKVDGTDGFEWVDGPLLVAVREGRPILLDEIALGDPKVLSTLYPLMDGRNELNVTSNPAIGVVKVQEGFFVLGATNPRAPGARMSEALLSRFALHTEITTNWKLAMQMGVPKELVMVAESLNRNVENNEISWAPQFRELLQYQQIEEKFGKEFALSNLLAMCPEDDREYVTETAFRGMRIRAFASRI